MADNITLEEIPFGNLDEEALNNTDSEDYYEDSTDIWNICSEFFEFSVLLVSLLSAILIIYIILKFNALRTRTNYYLMHYVIVNVLFIILNPFYELFVSFFIYYDFVTFPTVCTIYKIDEVVISMVQTFGFLLGLDYFLSCRLNQWLNVYERIQKFLIFGIYLLYLWEYIILIVPCIANDYALYSSETEVVTYGIILVLMTLLHILNCFKKLENLELVYAWKISNYIVYSWIPILLNYLSLSFLEDPSNAISNVLMLFIRFVLKVLIYSPPIVIAIWLPKLDSNFQKSYNIIFRSISKKYNQENLDSDNEENAPDTRPILI